MRMRVLVLVVVLLVCAGCGPSADLILAADKQAQAIAAAERNLTARFEALVGDDYERWRSVQSAVFVRKIEAAKDADGRVPAELVFSLLDEWEAVEQQAVAHKAEMLAKWDADLEDLRTAAKLNEVIRTWLGVLEPLEGGADSGR